MWHFHKKSKINRQSIRLIQRNGDSKHLNFTPLFGLLLNAAFSTIYGLVINNQTLILVNSIMFCLSLYYVVVYYSFAIEPRQKVTPSIFSFPWKSSSVKSTNPEISWNTFTYWRNLACCCNVACILSGGQIDPQNRTRNCQ